MARRDQKVFNRTKRHRRSAGVRAIQLVVCCQAVTIRSHTTASQLTIYPEELRTFAN